MTNPVGFAILAVIVGFVFGVLLTYLTINKAHTDDIQNLLKIIRDLITSNEDIIRINNKVIDNNKRIIDTLKDDGK